MRRRTEGIFAAAVSLVVSVSAANAQSFNCRYAHFPDEATICQQPALARLDNELAAVFGQRMRQLSPAARKSLEKEEEGWVVARRGCGRNLDCIEQRYRSRISQLSAMIADRRIDASRETVQQRQTERSPQPRAPAQQSQAIEPGLPPTAPAQKRAATSRAFQTISPKVPPAISEAGVAGASREPQRSGATKTAAPSIQWVDPMPQH